MTHEAKREDSWTAYGREHLEGRTIKAVRYLTQGETTALGWYKRPLVLELDDHTLVFPSVDDEGNDGGALFGQTAKGKELTFPVLS